MKWGPLAIPAAFAACTSFGGTDNSGTTTTTDGGADAASDGGKLPDDSGAPTISFCNQAANADAVACADFDTPYTGLWAESSNRESPRVDTNCTINPAYAKGKDGQGFRAAIPIGNGVLHAAQLLQVPQSPPAKFTLDADILVEKPTSEPFASAAIAILNISYGHQNGNVPTFNTQIAPSSESPDKTFNFFAYARGNDTPSARVSTANIDLPFDTWIHLTLSADLIGSQMGGGEIVVTAPSGTTTLSVTNVPREDAAMIGDPAGAIAEVGIQLTDDGETTKSPLNVVYDNLVGR